MVVVTPVRAPQLQEPIPSIQHIDRIAALGDPVLRNLQITQAYAELSLALARRTGGQANWCTFATWASKQAGQSIRKEDLRRALERAMRQALAPPEAPAEAQGQAAGAYAAAGAAAPDSPELRPAVERVAEAVGRGNRKVFAEIGRIFAAFLDEFGEDAQPDFDRLRRFCEDLRPGAPPDGQESLRRALTRIYQAFFEGDAKRQAELMLFANIEIGYHEQTRLQPEIAEALNAASVNLLALARLALRAGRYMTLAQIAQGRPLGLAFWLARRRVGRLAAADDALQAAAAMLQAQLRRAFTELLMTIQFPPDRVIRLGDDPRVPFPERLSAIADPDLRALLAELDPATEASDGGGAQDWADLRQRLRFIVRLFRGYQDTPDLFEPPFLPEQTVEIKAGRLPQGRL